PETNSRVNRTQSHKNVKVNRLEAHKNHSGRTFCASLFAAISQYFSSISIPMARRPKSFAALRVVPLPMKGSRTVSPGSVHVRTWPRAIDEGIRAGCPLLGSVLAGFRIHQLRRRPKS